MKFPYHAVKSPRISRSNRRRRYCKRVCGILATNIAVLLGLHTMNAATYYWDTNGATTGSGAATGTWSSAGSTTWSTDSTGATATGTVTTALGDNLFISAGTNGTTGTITVGGAVLANSITFDDAVAVTVSGGTSLTLGGSTGSGIFVTAAGADVVSTPVILDGGTTAFTYSNTSSSLLTIGATAGSAAAGTTQALTVTSTSSGGITINGSIGDGANGGKVALVINDTGTGATTLSAANSFSGGVTLQAGTLVLSNVTAFGNSNSFTINGGTTLNAGVANITSFTANNPTISLNGNFTVTGNALNLGAGAVALTGTNIGIVTNTTNNLTIGGNITGSSSLTKTAQSNGAFANMGALILNGTNSYTGGTIIQQGQIQFGSAASVPTTGSILLAGQGPNSAAYQGVAAVFNFALSQNELNKVSSASVGIVAMSAANGNALDFSSATGANLANVSLGAQTSSTYSGTLTPWTSSNNGAYLLGGSGNQSAGNNSTLTVSSVLANSGSVATGLVVDPTFVGFGAGTVSLTGINTYTGPTRVNTGTLKLDFSNNPDTNASNLVSSSSALGMANFATLNITGKSANTNSQTFNGLNLAGSNSTISATQNGATSLTANFGAITRGANGTVTFSVLPTAGGFTTTNSLDGSSGGGLLGPWATVGTGTGTTYATVSGGNIASYTGGTAAATAAALADTTGLVNYNLSAGGSLAGAVSLNTIRDIATAAASVDIGANNLTVNGLLHSGTGAFTITSSSTGDLVIGSNRELVVNASAGTVFLSAPIVDNAAGASSLTLTGNSGGQYTVITKPNTYTGGTFINGNVAVETATGGFGASTGLVTFSGGQVNFETTAITIANPLYFTPGTSTLLNPNSQSVTLTGAVTGSGTAFVGDGGSFASLNLNGDNSGFTGTFIYNSGGSSGDIFNVSGGTAASNNLSQATLIGISNGARRFSVSTGTLQLGALSGAFQLIGAATYQIGALNTNTTWGGSAAGGSNPVWVKVGAGTFTLAGAGTVNTGVGNMGDGGLSINNGTYVDDLSSLNNPVNQFISAPLTMQGGTLIVRGKATTLQNSSQAFSATTINAGASTIKVDNGSTGNAVATLAGLARNAGGTVNFVLPSGTQSGANGITSTALQNADVVNAIINSVSYATVNGTDWATWNGASGAQNIIARSTYATSMNGGADTDVTANGLTGSAGSNELTLRFNTDNVTLTLTGTGTGTSQANQVIYGGILTTANVTNGALITGGALQAGGGAEFVFATYGKLTIDSLIINSGTSATTTTALTKSGTGTLILTNTANTYSGVTYINEGILNIAVAGSLGTSTAANAISFNGGTLQLASSFNLNGNQGINLGFKGGTIDTNGFNSTYAGAIASSGAIMGTASENTADQFGFTKAGNGTLALTGTNTYAGTTTITGGILSVSYLDIATTAGNVTPVAAGGIGKSANNAKNLVLNGGTLQYTGAATSTDRLFTLGDNGGALDASGSGSVSFTNTGAVGYQINSTGGATNSSPTLTLTGTNTGANSLAASIGNNGFGTTSVTKSGTGTWALSGASTYSGATTVSSGELIVSGSLNGTVNVNVASGATLASGATGSITTSPGGNILVSGTLAPGDFGSVGTLSLAPGTGGKLSFLSGATFDFTISGAASDSVSFSTAGDWLSGSGNVTLSLSGITAADYGNTYTVFHNVSTTGFSFASITGYDSVDYAANFTQVGNDYELSFSAIPEPGMPISLLGGAGVLFILRRRGGKARA